MFANASMSGADVPSVLPGFAQMCRHVDKVCDADVRKAMPKLFSMVSGCGAAASELGKANVARLSLSTPHHDPPSTDRYPASLQTQTCRCCMVHPFFNIIYSLQWRSAASRDQGQQSCTVTFYGIEVATCALLLYTRQDIDAAKPDTYIN